MLSCSWIGHLCFCLKHKNTNIILHNPLDVKIEMQGTAARTPSCPHAEEEVPEGPRLSLLPFGLTASDILSVFGMPQSTSVWQVNFQIDFFLLRFQKDFHLWYQYVFQTRISGKIHFENIHHLISSVMSQFLSCAEGLTQE